MLQDSDYFDTSDYPNDHFLHSEINKKVIGKMKDEFPNGTLEEFIGLRPKMYSTLASEGSKRRAKGIAKNVVKKRLTHQDYHDALFSEKTQKLDMVRLGSDLHEIYTFKQRKSGLCCYDNKRYILPNGIDTLAHGHYTIRL